MKKTLFIGLFVIISLSFVVPAGALENRPVGWVTVSDGNVPYTITGGSGGEVVVATDEASFKTYAGSATPYIILVPNMLVMTRGAERATVASNKTILGINPNSGINGGLRISGKNNIIIRNLSIWYEDPNQAPLDSPWTDGISIQDGSHHIWVDHCSLYDSPDGLLDTSNQSNYITISWCKFYYLPDSANTIHHYPNLVGSNDTAYGDRGKLKMTFHHNWWAERCRSRMPRVRFGQVHVFNNYYSCPDNAYCIGVGVECQIKVESNYFDNVNKVWDNYSSEGIQGLIGWNNDNQFVNGTVIETWAPNDYNNIFTPPYPYTLEAGADVKDTVMTGAGAGFYYSDFDHSHTVEVNDLRIFAGYWLDTDCNQVGGIDYDSDCNVNNADFAFFAEQWGYKHDFIAPAAPTGLTLVATGDGTVSLDWNDNVEPDLACYNVYRSQTKGSGYSKINSSAVIDSNYIDNTVTNETVSWYAVTAVDIYNNESGYSNEVWAIPLDANSIVIQENETGDCVGDGTVFTQYAGYTGDGYYRTTLAVGKGLEWSISVPSDGTYTFKWRYALFSGDRTAKLLVDDANAVPSISFPSTGSWTNWQTVSQPVSLTAGTKAVRLESTTSSGLANIDYVLIAGDDPSPASCP